jgi:hypothetical protein
MKMLLVERYADSLCFAPDDVAGHAQAVGGEHQGKMFGNTYGAGHIKRGPVDGQVANHAIDRPAAKLDCSGLQDAVSGDSPVFVHLAKIGQNPNELIKRWTKIDNSGGIGTPETMFARVGKLLALPFRGVVFCLGQLGDVERGVAEPRFRLFTLF